VTEQGIFAAVALAVLFLDTDGKAGVPGGGDRRFPAARKIHVLEEHRGVAFQIALDVRGLITMALQTPDEDTEALEVIRVYAVGDRSPEPDILLLIGILDLPEGKIRHDATPFGVLGDFVGNRHVDAAREHPSRTSAGSADEAPLVRRHDLFSG